MGGMTLPINVKIHGKLSTVKPSGVDFEPSHTGVVKLSLPLEPQMVKFITQHNHINVLQAETSHWGTV